MRFVFTALVVGSMVVVAVVGCSDDSRPDTDGAGAGNGAGSSGSGIGGGAGSSGSGIGGTGGDGAGSGGSAGTGGAGSGGSAGSAAVGGEASPPDTLCVRAGESCARHPCCEGACIEGICGGPDAVPDGCMVDGRLYPDGATGIPAPDGCNTCFCENGLLSCTEMACVPEDDECVVAKQLDTCCDEYIAASSAEVAADECLVAYPATGLDPALNSSCKQKSPVDCALVLCELSEPLSRLATSDGSGGCRFADECQGPEDCVSAYDTRPCCTCEQVVPAALVGRDPCYVVSGTDPAVPESCRVCQGGPVCGACPLPPAPSCMIRNTFSLCVPEQ